MLLDHVCCSQGYEGCCASFVGATWRAGNGAGASQYTLCLGTGCRRTITVRRSWPETEAEQRRAGVCADLPRGLHGKAGSGTGHSAPPHPTLGHSSSSMAAVLRKFPPRFAPLFHPASPVLAKGGGVEMAGLAWAEVASTIKYLPSSGVRRARARSLCHLSQPHTHITHRRAVPPSPPVACV